MYETLHGPLTTKTNSYKTNTVKFSTKKKKSMTT